MTAHTLPHPTTTAHQRRLRAIVKQLVIELGYLEHCFAGGLQDTHLQTAATGMDSAIDALNDHLASQTAHRVA